MRLRENIHLDFADVLLEPKYSDSIRSRKDVEIIRTIKPKYAKHSFDAVPLIASNMDTVGTLEAGRSLSKSKAMTAVHKFTSIEEIHAEFQKEIAEYGESYLLFTLGCSEDDQKKLALLSDLCTAEEEEHLKICLDVPNGHMQFFLDQVKKTRELFPQAFILAGNVVTGSETEKVIQAGADCVKVGIGSGGQCTTRNVAGVGVPQLSSIFECADSAHGLNAHICSDGGIREFADAPKAFCAGADFVMIGSMLAGHYENTNEENLIKDNDGNVVATKVYGMSSADAMNKYYGGVASYRAPEGRSSEIEFRGNVQDTIDKFLGGIRSCCSYIGAKRIKDMPKCSTFIRVNRVN